MGRKEYQEFFSLKEDTEKKEKLVSELGKSVHNYIRTGVKNSQLDELLKVEEIFHQKYEECFEIDRMIKTIKRSSQERIKEYERLDCEKEQKNRADTLCNELYQNSTEIIQDVMDSMIDMVAEIAERELEKMLMDAVYLSHVNMLYELCEQEARLQREEREFERISVIHCKMADISKVLSKERRMELGELGNKVQISEQELGYVIEQCEEFFNIRRKKNVRMISLSPAGRRYKDYISNKKETRYDTTAWNQIVYKNCNNIIEGFKRSCDSGIKYELQLEGISSDCQRAVRHNYLKVLRDILDTDDAIYNIDDSMNTIRRRRKSNEKHQIKFSNRWVE